MSVGLVTSSAGFLLPPAHSAVLIVVTSAAMTQCLCVVLGLRVTESGLLSSPFVSITQAPFATRIATLSGSTATPRRRSGAGKHTLVDSGWCSRSALCPLVWRARSALGLGVSHWDHALPCTHWHRSKLIKGATAPSELLNPLPKEG